MTRASLWLPPLAYMALIFHFSSQSNPLPVVTAHVWDKLLHTLEYAGLGALFGRALLGEGLGWAATFAVAVLLASGYGATDEYHQLFVRCGTAISRTGSWTSSRLSLLGALLCAVQPAASRAASNRLDVGGVDFDAHRLADQIDRQHERRAFGASFRSSRPTTPRSGPWITSTIIPSWMSGHGSNCRSLPTSSRMLSSSYSGIAAGLPSTDTMLTTPAHFRIGSASSGSNCAKQ